MSVTSVAPFDRDELEKMLSLITEIKGSSGKVKAKFFNFCGQPGARLDSDQTIYFKDHDHQSLLFIIASLLLFGAPHTHQEDLKLKKIWVDRIINHVLWNQFIGKLNDEWTGLALSLFSMPTWPFLQFHLYRTPLITAMVAFSILIIVSLRPVCSDIYEVFFYVHFLGVLIFLVGGYYHTKGAHGSYWIWPSFVFWASDHFIWVVQLVVFNHSYFGFKSGAGTMNTTTELLSEDIIRLHLCQPQHFHWSPGQTAYLIMPSVFTLPFKVHPFTIASFDSSPLSTTKLEDQSESSENYETQVLASGAPFWKELVFLVNVHGGFTKKLKEVATAKGQVKVFVDGPYGLSSDLSSYDTSVFVSGGSGILYTLPVFLSVIEHVDLFDCYY
ncbi:hypothetical protein BD769DRAFT_1746788 [Suillus cothurnatus]|nr:hypothetical protein BD769DRAFT_1746788 [Suillus cothurnatus]